jgi:hypothetical protein
VFKWVEEAPPAQVCGRRPACSIAVSASPTTTTQATSRSKVVEGSAEGVDEGVAELTAPVDRAGGRKLTWGLLVSLADQPVQMGK